MRKWGNIKVWKQSRTDFLLIVGKVSRYTSVPVEGSNGLTVGYVLRKKKTVYVTRSAHDGG